VELVDGMELVDGVELVGGMGKRRFPVNETVWFAYTFAFSGGNPVWVACIFS
jgi:hypothetical protein